MAGRAYPGAVNDSDEFFVRVDMRPPPPPARAPRNAPWGVIVVALVLVPMAVIGFALAHGRNRHRAAPVVLAPRAATAGLPTSLADVVRIEAESTRHTALQAVENAATANGTADIGNVAAMQPSYTWLVGTQPSTGPQVVSFEDANGVATIAVGASNKDVCAFGRWSPNTTPTYVTMAHLPACRAVDAPASGWSTEPGGAASDLPDAQP